ncbi:MAG: hypothetical protein A2087_05380 [Spirochaetes bacterium GWD1_61_31]|nr:MAG: hypothetical protein A2Y37_10555 [Spirochaetes bacterium GWB1_60_80]OHD29764.1 MAG: hypothetical protein A2004_04830 [Spirochaetes bacterium GWC1_61_12]OHD42895.1 MAG: hypothetical protein A2Y35_13965 [Spirochaetes bacterium GWE1_60_18]OHD43472.1 MAG: hypothetical protein A2087_05380 [Spirochaetes bacterium GWD1_61_31]OHD59567.1 MAG: hypothetical protein A2Y32_12590 [Spirochaetes bacterium GWF1_60_12]HAP43760.1 YigZ family protein [Spirochaetaceae bacterium]
MSAAWLVPLEAVRTNLTVVNSRFISSLAPAGNVTEARHYIQVIRKEFPDATHHVPAFIIGGGNSATESCSDDGEPSGTAGRPILTVLKGSGLGNVVLVISRWFGGTQLGTGGLVKAYTEAAQQALRLVKPAREVLVHRLELTLPYPLYERVKLETAAIGATIVHENFDEAVHLAIELAVESLADYQRRLDSLSSGRLQPTIVDSGIRRRPA